VSTFAEPLHFPACAVHLPCKMEAMIKRIDVEIDQASWLTSPQGKQHPFPAQLASQPVYHDLDFLRALLWIGVLSIPVRIPRWWLAIRWAQTRYLGIVDDASPDLRLHAGAEDLDAHQKAVLSDDWGMGISLQWLDQVFGYSWLENGASFLKRLERRGIAQFQRPAGKRGPNKCPDFVGVDPGGMLHLIECKGTQGGRTALDDQLTKGRPQKHCVSFGNRELQHVSQRLVAGVAIATRESSLNTLLKIEDPPAPEPERAQYVVKADSAESLREEVEIGSFARMLVLSGESSVLARILPDELEESSLSNIDVRPPRTRFVADDREWVGHVDRIRLPAPIRVGDRVVRWFSIRHGVNREFLDSLSSVEPTDRDALRERLSQRTHLERDSESTSHARDGDYAAIHWGDSFLSDLRIH
jgi:hypothetical protein